MSRLEIILSAILLLSMSFNIVVFIYARGAVTRLLSVSEELGDLQAMIDNFVEHITSVYEMEMFYGDETLGFLVEHTKSLYDILEDYEDAYTIAMPPENTEEQVNNKEEEKNNAEKKIPQQDVFYAGTRTSDN